MERGMYIRCPIAEFDDPRNFIVGRIIQVDDFTENGKYVIIRTLTF